ncbi:type II toxin-antitoxin system VapC family toxin [Saccharothrix yanglingensis]|uniref:Twitching motility protein PilT n=1 Tax=Saccharothrix yanglingensis TaxID=659496 RepID=A0ABU0WU66_9PSEU|nr:type II toxin-antitoxin system VapC family toxin [Saccharothrix yanglingensis]MDQ2583391.1 twitching motility protein PilT [Saccharothrix yanglingensis]
MAERRQSGVLDTCTYIDLDLLDPAVLPQFPRLTAVSVGELHQGVVWARDAATRALRTEKLGAAIVEFEPLPFDGQAAARYGSLVGLTLAANRDPRPRKIDLMIAATASVNDLPLYTRNPKDFLGLESMVEVIAV